MRLSFSTSYLGRFIVFKSWKWPTKEGHLSLKGAHFLLVAASLVLNVASGPQISISHVMW